MRYDERYCRQPKNDCCGTCKDATYDKMQGYVYVNDSSDYAAYFVEFNHVCDEWEGN